MEDVHNSIMEDRSQQAVVSTDQHLDCPDSTKEQVPEAGVSGRH